MRQPTKQNDVVLELGREEQWVAHHVMLDRMELEASAPSNTDPPPLSVYRVFEKLEAGVHQFSREERRCLETELTRYAEAVGTPERDKPIIESILDRLCRSDGVEADAIV